MKLSPWYPPSIQPVRRGCYEAKPLPNWHSHWIMKWDGKHWIWPDGDVSILAWTWRGLAEKP